MTTFSQQHSTGLSSGTPRMSVVGQQPEFSSDQTAHWRNQINEYKHAIIVLNSQFQPILLNDALRARLSDPGTIEGANQPTAFVWQTICETAARIASEHAQTAHSPEIAQAFPVNQRCYVAVGSLIRNAAGQTVGAVLNLADLSASRDRLHEFFGPSAETQPQDNSIDEAFLAWASRREQAISKMSRLSRRESQVVDLVSDGLPNKSIAHELDISVKTIEKHRANATRKLGVGSTAEMVRIAVVAGNKSPEVDRTPPEPPPARPLSIY